MGHRQHLHHPSLATNEAKPHQFSFTYSRTCPLSLTSTTVGTRPNHLRSAAVPAHTLPFIDKPHHPPSCLEIPASDHHGRDTTPRGPSQASVMAMPSKRHGTQASHTRGTIAEIEETRIKTSTRGNNEPDRIPCVLNHPFLCSNT